MYNFGWLTVSLAKVAEFDALFHKFGTWTTPEIPLYEENFAMIKMNHVGKITDTELPLFAGDNAYLKDFAVSNDEQAPITAGLFRLEAGEPITYTYSYEEKKSKIDGEFQGACYPFIFKRLGGGVNRLIFDRQGTLWVGFTGRGWAPGARRARRRR